MKNLAPALALILMAASPLALAECPAPPVQSSSQAVCYANAYAEKNGLPRGPEFRKRASKSKNVWTVSYVDSRPDAPTAGWQVNVDTASGTVTRFTAYKKPENKPR